MSKPAAKPAAAAAPVVNTQELGAKEKAIYQTMMVGLLFYLAAHLVALLICSGVLQLHLQGGRRHILRLTLQLASSFLLCRTL